MRETRVNDSKLLVDKVVEAIFEKKGEDVISINLSKVEHAICDYFIICEGSSTTQVSAIADYVDFFVKKELSEYPRNIEGMQLGNWVLLDYGDVVVHIFLKEKRQFYNLEALWADGVVKRLEDVK